MTRRDQQRLRLHRETLRVLTPRALARVAGGDRRTTDAPPKSNAWTGGTFDLETALVCTATTVG